VEDSFKNEFPILLDIRRKAGCSTWSEARMLRDEGCCDDSGAKKLSWWQKPIPKTSHDSTFALDFLFDRLEKSYQYCSICHGPVQFTAQAFKPFVCDKEICFFMLTELGFSVLMESEVRKNPEVTDLLLSLAYVAAQGPAGSLPCLLKGWTHEFVKTSIEAMPSVASMNHSLVTTPNSSLRDILSPDPYKVMQYILTVNRSLIQVLPNDDRIQGLPNFHQFRMVMSSPAKEAEFQKVFRFNSDYERQCKTN
jgi:hypothetical protein